jgi:hypothetical protein
MRLGFCFFRIPHSSFPVAPQLLTKANALSLTRAAGMPGHDNPRPEARISATPFPAPLSTKALAAVDRASTSICQRTARTPPIGAPAPGPHPIWPGQPHTPNIYTSRKIASLFSFHPAPTLHLPSSRRPSAPLASWRLKIDGFILLFCHPPDCSFH